MGAVHGMLKRLHSAEGVKEMSRLDHELDKILGDKNLQAAGDKLDAARNDMNRNNTTVLQSIKHNLINASLALATANQAIDFLIRAFEEKK